MAAPERFAESQIPLAPRAVAVGTEITLRPPHRTRRALLTHRAPTLDGDEESLPILRLDQVSIFEHACRQPFANQPNNSPVANPMFD